MQISWVENTRHFHPLTQQKWQASRPHHTIHMPGLNSMWVDGCVIMSNTHSQPLPAVQNWWKPAGTILHPNKMWGSQHWYIPDNKNQHWSWLLPTFLSGFGWSSRERWHHTEVWSRKTSVLEIMSGRSVICKFLFPYQSLSVLNCQLF